MTEQISALMDGELEDEAALREAALMRDKAALAETWDAYHLIGDTLRGDFYPGYQGRVAARLAAEPTVLAPKRNTVPIWRYVLSAAAGIAGVALVVWTASPGRSPESQGSANMAAASRPASQSRVGGGNVENYLFAHPRFSPASVTLNIEPRLVVEERKETDR